MPYKITVDRNLCIGSAPCFAIAPKVFKIDEENKAVVVDENGADEQTILAAAQACPTLAIILKNKLNGKKIYP